LASRWSTYRVRLRNRPVAMPMAISMAMSMAIRELCHGFKADRTHRKLRWCTCFSFQDIVINLRYHPFTIFILLCDPWSLRCFLLLQMLLCTDDVVINAKVWNDILLLFLSFEVIRNI
jgi:hypothetical protein